MFFLARWSTTMAGQEPGAGQSVLCCYRIGRQGRHSRAYDSRHGISDRYGPGLMCASSCDTANRKVGNRHTGNYRLQEFPATVEQKGQGRRRLSTVHSALPPYSLSSFCLLSPVLLSFYTLHYRPGVLDGWQHSMSRRYVLHKLFASLYNTSCNEFVNHQCGAGSIKLFNGFEGMTVATFTKHKRPPSRGDEEYRAPRWASTKDFRASALATRYK